MEVARDVSERYRQTEGWIEAMAEQGVEGLLLIGLWEKTKATQTLESPQSDPKNHSASMGRAQGCLQQEGDAGGN